MWTLPWPFSSGTTRCSGTTPTWSSGTTPEKAIRSARKLGIRSRADSLCQLLHRWVILLLQIPRQDLPQEEHQWCNDVLPANGLPSSAVSGQEDGVLQAGLCLHALEACRSVAEEGAVLGEDLQRQPSFSSSSSATRAALPLAGKLIRLTPKPHLIDWIAEVLQHAACHTWLRDQQQSRYHHVLE